MLTAKKVKVTETKGGYTTPHFLMRELALYIFYFSCLFLIIRNNIPDNSLILYSDFYFPLTHSEQILARYFKTVADWNYPQFNNPRQLMQSCYQLIIYSMYSVGFSMPFIQKALIFCLMVTAIEGVRKLLKIFNNSVNNNYDILPIIAGFIYLFNPFAVSSLWQRINLGIIAYCLFPIFVYVIIKILNYRSRLQITFFALLLFLITQTSNPVHIFSSLFFGIIFALLLKKNIDFKNDFKFISLMLVVAVFVNSYWIWPFIHDLSNQYQVSKNNITAPNLFEMRTALASKATVYNWFSFNPFWTGHEASIVKSADFLKYAQFSLITLFALAVYNFRNEVFSLKNINIRLLIITLILPIFFVKYMLYLPFWGMLDAIGVGAGYRDPFEKCGYFFILISTIFIFNCFSSISLGRKLIVGAIGCLVLVPAFSGDLFFKDRKDPYQATGEIPIFFKDPDNLHGIIGKDKKILPYPFFERTFGSVYQLEVGSFTGMSPLYWQNNVQIVSGYSDFTQYIEEEFGKNLTNSNLIKLIEFLKSNSINYIFLSKNFKCHSSNTINCEKQNANLELMLHYRMIELVFKNHPYEIYFIK